MPAGVVGHDPVTAREPRGGAGPLPRMAGEAMQEKDRRAVAAEVPAREPDAVARQLMPMGHA
jgi:hypothetical protein